MPTVKELEEFLGVYRESGIQIIDYNPGNRRWIISVDIYEYSPEN